MNEEEAHDGGARPGDDHVTQAEVMAAGLRHITTAHRNYEAAQKNLADMLIAMRDLGATWDQLGASMGMSRQTAHKRFGHWLD